MAYIALALGLAPAAVASVQRVTPAYRSSCLGRALEEFWRHETTEVFGRHIGWHS